MRGDGKANEISHVPYSTVNFRFEKIQIVLCEIEAVLNSQPLTPLSADSNDLFCVTGHFLTQH